jgi:hypothetical protein
LINVRRVVQTMIAAKGSDGRPFIERFHGFRNGVGNTVGKFAVHIAPSNVGASRLGGALEDDDAQVRADNVTEIVDTVHLEDLLYNMPEDERPQIRVGHKDSNGNWVYAMEPLQPKHIYIVKVDVEGYDVAVLHSLQRVLSSAVRPVAITAEFEPRFVSDTNCKATEFVKFMYHNGYQYEGVPHLEEMLKKTAASVNGPIDYSNDAENASDVYEGWWDLVRSDF